MEAEARERPWVVMAVAIKCCTNQNQYSVVSNEAVQSSESEPQVLAAAVVLHYQSKKKTVPKSDESAEQLVLGCRMALSAPAW